MKTRNRSTRWLLCFLGLVVPLSAAPTLRLSTSAVGPIIIAAGQNGTAQVVEAANVGDGTLALTTSSDVPWMSASVGAIRQCTIRPACSPLTIALNTAALAKGKYTGTITLTDPNAIDTPQTISVTVQIGSGIPDSLDLYLPPAGSTGASFTTGSNPRTAVTAPAGQTLSVAATGGGSFSFTYSFQVTASSPAGTADGDYRGSFTTSGATVATDNKTVPVTLHVTSQPIADYTPDTVRFRIAQGAAKVDKWIQFKNRGLAALTLSGVTVNNATWLTGKISGNIVVLTADPTGLSPGAQNASVTIASNAKNGPFTVPVTLTILPVSPPTSFYQGVLDNALFQVGDPVAPGGIVAVTGEQFTTGVPAQAASLPLGTTLGGATVFVNNSPVPVYYVAASHVVNNGGQINFQIPYNTPPGQATVRVDRDGQRGNTVTVVVAPSVPRLLRLGIADYAIALDGASYPIPPTDGIASQRAKIGEVLTFYALGLGQTDPLVVEGAAAPGAEPFARVAGYRVFFGPGNLPNSGVAADPFFVGLAPGFVGLYQINVTIPPEAPHGDAVVVDLAAGAMQSNRVTIAIE